MKFSILTLISFSVAALAAPVEQARRDTAAMANGANTNMPLPGTFGLIPSPLDLISAARKRHEERKQRFFVAKAAFIGAKIGSSGAGPGAFFGAKLGAQRGVKKAMRGRGRQSPFSMFGGGGRGGRRSSGWGPFRRDVRQQDRDGFEEMEESGWFDASSEDAEGAENAENENGEEMDYVKTDKAPVKYSDSTIDKALNAALEILEKDADAASSSVSSAPTVAPTVAPTPKAAFSSMSSVSSMSSASLSSMASSAAPIPTPSVA